MKFLGERNFLVPKLKKRVGRVGGKREGGGKIRVAFCDQGWNR